LVIKETDTDLSPPPMYSTASRDEKTGDVILKVVNAGTEAADTTINLRGAKEVQATGKAIVLTSDSPRDQNTIANPTKVTPKEEPITDAAATFHRSFPANSVTVLRLSATAP
jgi:alpha-L-arabinofuranosidase